METVDAQAKLEGRATLKPKAEVRLSLIVSPELNETLEGLAESLHSSKSEVLRKAIALFVVAAEAKKKNQRLGILDSDRQVLTEIVGI
jgi:predicted transcriptional regulator